MAGTFCTGPGDTSPEVPNGTNNEISSVRVFGNAEVTVFSDKGFRGSARRLQDDVTDLRRWGWNDRISSYRVDSRGNWGGDGGRGSGPSWGRPSVPSAGVCFYEHINFGGRYFCARAGSATTNVPQGMNNEISSIRVFGNADVTVFRDNNFEGSSRRFDYDTGDLRNQGLNDRISSFQVGTRGYGNRGGGGPSGGNRWTYQQADQIVQRAYLSVLQREPDDAGRRSWINEVMKNNMTQQQLENELKKSAEYRNRRR